jgi:hypothetical protein
MNPISAASSGATLGLDSHFEGLSVFPLLAGGERNAPAHDEPVVHLSTFAA